MTPRKSAPSRATPRRVRDATRYIAEADPDFRHIINVSEPCNIARRSNDDSSPYSALVTSVVSQQLSTSIARLMTQRVRELAGGDINAESIAELSVDDLRSAGLSGAKARTIMGLTHATIDGSIDLDELSSYADEEHITTSLTKLWGIGPWTTHMFLIFHLGRLDVWPVGDLGVRKGWQVIHGGDGDPGPEALVDAATHLQPYRSVAAWYCWRAWESASGR